MATNGTERKTKDVQVYSKKEDGTFEDIDAIIVSDNGGITWFTSGRFRKKITFPYLPPIHPEKVYIEYTEDVPAGFTGDKYEIITEQPERIKALYEKKRREFDEALKENEDGNCSFFLPLELLFCGDGQVLRPCGICCSVTD